MQENVSKTVSDVLAVLADKFGTTLEHLRAVIVHQVYVTAMQNVAFAIVLAAASYGLLRYTRYAAAEVKEDRYSAHAVGFVFAWCGVGGALIGASALLIGAVSRLMNPEFYALNYVLYFIQ